MRFGKKLALLIEGDARKGLLRPFISYSDIKNELSIFLNQLRLTEYMGGIESELMIVKFQELFLFDIASISMYIHASVKSFRDEIANLVNVGRDMGIIDSDIVERLLGNVSDVCVNLCVYMYLSDFRKSKQDLVAQCSVRFAEIGLVNSHD